jgi:glycosyltransferase involved in cell wall biosynthesis
VVLPFRDAGKPFADSLESIRRQSLDDFECVLIDHGSVDDSRRLAEQTCRADDRFRLVAAEGSFVDALNAGIRATRAPLIARMDADDIAHPRRLERQLAVFDAAPSLGIVSCLVSCFAEHRLGDGMRRYEQWLNELCRPEEIRDALFIESPLVHPSVVLSRAALEAVGGYRDTGGPEDYDLWMRLLLRGYDATKVPEVLLQWRDSSRRLTRVDPRYARQRFFETKLRHFPTFLPKDRPVQIWGTGPTGRKWGHALQRSGYVVRRFVDIDPRRIGRRKCGAPIEAPSELHAADGLVLAAVGVLGARKEIESFLQERGMRPWNEYVAVA